MNNHTRLGNLDRSDIIEKISPIEGSSTDYISENGNVYKLMKNNKFYKKKLYINKNNGYAYCGISMDTGVNKSHRIHILTAKAFIPNPNNYNIVGHDDNIKNHNEYTNLYWTTTSENTQKAFDDGLAKNASGYDDNQSIPVIMYYDNIPYGAYGSIKECNRITGIPVSTIIRRANNEIDATDYRRYKNIGFKYQENSLTTIESTSMIKFIDE